MIKTRRINMADDFNKLKEIPEFLMTGFKDLSLDAKYFYISLLYEIATKTMYFDENDDVYTICTHHELMEKLQKSEPTIIKLKKELQKYNLFQEVNEVRNKPNLLYFYIPCDTQNKLERKIKHKKIKHKKDNVIQNNFKHKENNADLNNSIYNIYNTKDVLKDVKDVNTTTTCFNKQSDVVVDCNNFGFCEIEYPDYEYDSATSNTVKDVSKKEYIPTDNVNLEAQESTKHSDTNVPQDTYESTYKYKTIKDKPASTDDNTFMQEFASSIKEKYGFTLHINHLKHMLMEKGKKLLTKYGDKFSCIINSYTKAGKTIRSLGGLFKSAVMNEFVIPDSLEGTKQQGSKPIQATNYEQRKYDDAFFDSLYDNVNLV